MKKVSVVVLFIAIAVPFIGAQDVPRAEVFGGYSYLNIDTNGLSARQSAHGWGASAAVNLNKWFAVEGDVSGHYKTSDEAYALARDSGEFGQEAIDTLIKAMEDHREDLVVIAAGYVDEMGKFLNANPGMQSRFNKYFQFDDYNAEELLQIFHLFCKQSDYVVSAEAESRVQMLFATAYTTRTRTFGNGRFARNVFESCVNHQANRIVQMEHVDDTVLRTLEGEDVPEAMQGFTATVAHA